MGGMCQVPRYMLQHLSACRPCAFSTRFAEIHKARGQTVCRACAFSRVHTQPSERASDSCRFIAEG